jgi:multidrug efflux pump subunit AcrA (membrane-fusion protein)
MSKGWLWGSISAGAIALFISGYLVGFAVYQPDVSSLEAETEIQKEELSSLQSRLSDRDTQLAAVVTELSDEKASRIGLETSLESSRNFLTEARASSESASADLLEARTNLTSLESNLSQAQSDQIELTNQVRTLKGAQDDLDMAITIQSELQALINDDLGPNHGDALLLIQEGLLAVINTNFGEAATFFDESSKAFDTAKDNAQVAVTKSEALLELVPSGLHTTFNTSHRQSKSTVLALDAQSREYKGASALYVIIDEWNEVDLEGSGEDIERWRGMATEAEDLLEAAMTKLDEADGWAPGLWRRSEAIRLDIRQWQDLLSGVEVIILDPA